MSLAFSPGKTSLAGLDWLNLLLSKSLLPPHPVTIGGVCVAWDAGAWMKRSRKTTRPVGNTIFAASFDRCKGPNLDDTTDQHAVFAQGGTWASTTAVVPNVLLQNKQAEVFVRSVYKWLETNTQNCMCGVVASTFEWRANRIT